MQNFIVVALGVLVGLGLDEGAGALWGGLLAWVLLRLHRQTGEIGALRSALQAQHATLNELAAQRSAAPPEAAAAVVVTATTAPVSPAARPRQASELETFTAPPSQPVAAGTRPPPTEDAPAAWRQPATPAAPPQAAWLTALRGWLFGGNTIVKSGVGILFLGLAFLAKYASEHVQLPVELRLAAVGAVALVLLALGWRLRVRRAGYAQALQGGAVAVLYLTLFVAFRAYGVLAVGPVFVMMALVAALSAALAVLQDSRALAVLGALGGFAAPLLVSTGTGNVVALFGYYLVLELGIAAVAWARTWRLLNVIGFVATFLVATAWGVLKDQPADYATGQAFLVGFFLVFILILLLPARATAAPAEAMPGRTDAWLQGSLLFGLPTITFVLQHGLVRDTEYGTALSALVLAGFYVGLALWARRDEKHGTKHGALVEPALAIATVFITLVIPFAFDARSTAGAWALEGAALVWLGLRQARRPARLFGYGLVLLAGLALVFAGQGHGTQTLWLDTLLINGLLLVAAALAAAFFVQRARAGGQWPAKVGLLDEAAAEPLLTAWAMLWAVVAAARQIDGLVPAPYQLSAGLVAGSLIAALCTLLAWRLHWKLVAWPALAHVPWLAASLLASAATQASPLAAGGWWAWPLALAAQLFVLRKAAPHWPAPGPAAIHALGLLTLAAWGALQGSSITSDWGDLSSAWPWLGWLAVPAMLLLWLSRPASADVWPLRDQPVACRSLAGGVLAIGALLWTLLASALSSGGAQPLPYLPLLNPLDLGVGVALFAAALWWRSDAQQAALNFAMTAGQPLLGVALISGTAFVWLNAMLLRAFHHYGDVPWQLAAWTGSRAVQTGVTLLWASTALVLMWGAARHHLRTPWMAGAALLGAVVLKLLLVDLSGSGTVPRIVSFIGVGVLMLVIGYVAPLPAARQQAAAP